MDVDILMRKRLNRLRGMGTYQRVEAGTRTPSPEYLLHLAQLLGLAESEYVAIHLELYGVEPTHSLDPASGLEVVSAWRKVVEAQQDMAYLTDRRYNLLFHNEAFAAMFPSGQPPQNTMEWMILDDEARDFCLVDWEREWASRAIPQFRMALASQPRDPVLNRIHEGILRDERARKIYDGSADVYLHPDGERRPLHHARRGRGWVEMVAGQPLSSPGARFMLVMFEEGQQGARI
ncbi:XRE family transcriptional regulator [Streptomyces sp. NPDC059002]|uniref:MmyB family transcriptional regulator n=1 Tax=Streptomyces sp. NPDC059002 TaxID=3346690 RepID=UPI0036783206